MDPMAEGLGMETALAGTGGGFMGPPPEGPRVDREPPPAGNPNAELVKSWIDRIDEAKTFWRGRFKRMRRDAKFALGRQWDTVDEDEEESGEYQANITLRHINQRVAALYAKNPRVRATRRPRIYGTVWDGSQEQLLMAAQGMPEPLQAMAILQEATQAQADKALYAKLGKTLEIVAHYTLDEPIPRFKTSAKQLVRRVLATGVGYVKLGYQRIMETSPDVEAKIRDATDRLARLEQLAADLADGEIDQNSIEAAELRTNLEALQQQQQIMLREGVVFSFPKSWSIIVDPEVQQIKGFVGAGWLCQMYLFTPERVQQLYGKDIKASFTTYTAEGTKKGHSRRQKESFAAVYEVYDLNGQVCFTICDGFADFLREPGEPDVKLEQFHPFYTLTFNDVEPEGEKGDVIPPSNVELIRPMQREYNRARQGVRVHRIANRPGYVSPAGIFDSEDKTKLATHDDHEIIELKISKNDKAADLLQPKPTVQITPELYDVEGVFTDIQRVAGDQEANLGGISGGTATEASIAENSRGTSIQSNIDDLDDFLTDLMRGVGQVLLLEMSEQTVKEIAGPGAAWPTLSREEVAKEIRLEIKAGSAGKPNRAARAAAIEKYMPLLLQIPGIKPEKLGEFMLAELDENIDVEDFMDAALPSITAMNSMSKPNLAAGPGGPAQGPAGHMNAPAPGQSGAKAQNTDPAPSQEQHGQLPH